MKDPMDCTAGEVQAMRDQGVIAKGKLRPEKVEHWAYLTFTIPEGGGLTMTPTPEGIEWARELREKREAREISCDGAICEMIEDALGNGWAMIPPEACGALTDAPVVSQDFNMDDGGTWVPVDATTVVFAHMNYAVEDPIETWAEGQPVYWWRGLSQRRERP